MHRPHTESHVEPIPGYRVLDPIGKGPLGEVWKCVAPGGILKAMKFVRRTSLATRCGDDLALEELQALERMRSIRHPLLLTLDQVTVVGDDLVLVMELADHSLDELRRKYTALARPGIPRDELVSYFIDAAEGLDALRQQYGQQHLDVKPRNLLVVGDRLKLGDYGLVASVVPDDATETVPPQSRWVSHYAAPELLDHGPSDASDQYSLALTYVELLTNRWPFGGRAQRVGPQPRDRILDLRALPREDRAAVERALAIDPRERFADCRTFVRALWGARGEQGGGLAYGQPRLAEVRLPSAGAARPTDPCVPFPAKSLLGLLAGLRQRQLCVTALDEARLVRPAILTDHFGTQMQPALAAVQLEGFRQDWQAALVHEEQHYLCFKLPLVPTYWQGCARQRPWLEVHVSLATPRALVAGLTEATVELHVRDVSPVQEQRVVEDVGPKILRSLRHWFGASDERRGQERLRFEHRVEVTPLDDATPEARPLEGWCKDVSPQGMLLVLPEKPVTHSISIRLAAHDWAGLTLPARIVRVQPIGDDGYEVGCMFLLEGWSDELGRNDALHSLSPLGRGSG